MKEKWTFVGLFFNIFQDEAEKKEEKEKKKEPEPNFQLLDNPARVMPAQLKVLTMPETCRYQPFKPVSYWWPLAIYQWDINSWNSGILTEEDKSPKHWRKLLVQIA